MRGLGPGSCLWQRQEQGTLFSCLSLVSCLQLENFMKPAFPNWRLHRTERHSVQWDGEEQAFPLQRAIEFAQQLRKVWLLLMIYMKNTEA